jgi:thiamine-monophosphate kinase
VPLPEKSLIAQLRRAARSRSSVVIQGIGDDCAVLRPASGHDLLVTTDFSLEGIHFRRGWHPPESVGHRCLTRGLSDIAAMGGKPIAAFLSLAVPANVPESWVNRFTRGLLDLARKHAVTLAGGDTAESPDSILADIIVLGTVPKGKAVLRSGARPGDLIYVSGELGASAAALQELRANHGKKINVRDYRRHFYPEARLEVGRILREKNLASAMIDTSDGLSTDLNHICEESEVGAEIEQALIPRARVGRARHDVELELALHGGEDYELLFTAPAKKAIPAQIVQIPITQIGRVSRRSGIRLIVEGGARPLRPQGWEHFQSGKE